MNELFLINYEQLVLTMYQFGGLGIILKYFVDQIKIFCSFPCINCDFMDLRKTKVLCTSNKKGDKSVRRASEKKFTTS